MAHEQHTYICIDLKTFYASVECVDRGLDPLTTNLVVADESRGRTTICLAITQAMKDLGIHNRCRLFEIPDGIDCIKAVPRMQHYMEVSAQIYGIYLEYVSPQDVHVYSIDECFIDVTPYLDLYHTDAEGFACMLRDEVLARTGITATVAADTGKLTYDGMALDFGLLANGNVVPAAAPAIAADCWLRQYISSAGYEDERYRVTYERDFDEKCLFVDTWFENAVPICAEVCYNGQRILKIQITEFQLQ